jgi:hypothetical protein
VVELMAKQITDSFPELPAAPFLRCALSERHGQLDEAERQCRLASSRQADSPLILRLSGELSHRSKKRRR